MGWDQVDLTYIEISGAHMGSEVLLVGTRCTKLIAGCDHPESDGWVIFAYPPMNLIVFVLHRVLVLVIHLRPTIHYHGSQTQFYHYILLSQKYELKPKAYPTK